MPTDKPESKFQVLKCLKVKIDVGKKVKIVLYSLTLTIFMITIEFDKITMEYICTILLTFPVLSILLLPL